MRKYSLVSLLAGLFFCSSNYASTDLDDLTIKFNGFASVVTGATTESDESITVATSGFDQTIYDQDASFDLESIASLQANASLGGDLSVVIQFVARGVDEWNLETEWSYISYELSESSRINAGRLRLPLYMYSDFLEVGYAYPWIRPPSSVYSGAPSSFDGISYTYSTYLGDWELNAQVVSNLDTTHGANVSFVYDWLTLRFAYQEAELDIDIEVLANAAQDLVGLGLVNDVDDILVSEDTVEFYGVGLKIEYGNYFFLSEYTEGHFAKGWFPDSERYFVSGGVTLGDFLLHLTYGENDSESGFEDLGLPAIDDIGEVIAAGVSPGDFGTFFPAAGISSGFYDSLAEDTSTVTLGLRYDFHPSAALKFEVTQREDDLYDPDATVAGPTPGEKTPGTGDATLVNIGIDVVF